MCLPLRVYSHLYLKLAKRLCFSYYCFCFIFNKIREQEGRQVLPGKEGMGERERGEGWRGGPNNAYTYE
jgi:hypothetical protein